MRRRSYLVCGVLLAVAGVGACQASYIDLDWSLGGGGAGTTSTTTDTTTGTSSSTMSAAGGAAACLPGPVGGDHVWSQGYSGSDQLTGHVAVDAAGDVLMAGVFTGSINLGGTTLVASHPSDALTFVAKLDRDGKHQWSKGFGNGSYADPIGLATDAAGDIVVAGSFEGSVDFGGGALTSAGGPNIFLVKLDASGGHVWSRHFGDATAGAAGVAVDASGNVLLSGYLEGSIDFGDGAVLTSTGGADAFVAKLDPNGAHVWSESFGEATPGAIAADVAGNAFLLGAFSGSIDLGGGKLTSVGGENLFLAKLDQGGAPVWSKAFPGGSAVGDLTLDGSGNVLMTGYLKGPVDFGGGPLALVGNNDLFIAKLSPGGGHLWSKSFGAKQAVSRGTAISADPSGNVFVSGFFDGTIDLGGGELISAGSDDVLIGSFDASGKYRWAKRFGDPQSQEGWGIAVDPLCHVTVVGGYEGVFDLGGNPLATTTGQSLFVGELTE